jgi:glucose/arabinose dehydrogenase
MDRNFYKGLVVFFACLAVALLLVFGGFQISKNRTKTAPEQTLQAQPDPLKKPTLKAAALIKGLDHPWDIAFLPDDTLLFTERAGTISKVIDGKKQVVHTIKGIYVRGESGLLGLAVDPEFLDNRYVYACYSTVSDVRVARWTANSAVTALEDEKDIITGLPLNLKTFPGRHAGCRLQFGADKVLWVGTGDAAIGTNPQNPASLGGKILRVDRDGNAAKGNLEPPFDPRIFSYGHRNVQGLALLQSPKGDVYGYSIEHGTDNDDEVNVLVPGNFGYDPIPGYNESVSMTDASKFPAAIDAVWSSGTPTIAPSGATIITGKNWELYNGRLAVAVLKGQHLRIMKAGGHDKILEDDKEFQDRFGRLRTVVMGPDNAMYLSTDNGSGIDQIIKVTPVD